MARLAPGVKLLRSLARAATAQRKMALGMLGALAPAKPARKPAKRASKPAAKPASKLAAKPSGTAPRTIKAPPARPPAAAPPAGGRWLSGSHPLAPGALLQMDYWLYLPPGVPAPVAQQGWPLVVMLHGCHQSASEFAEGTRMNRLAEAKGYAVLYPQQSTRLHAQRCWRWYERAVQHGGGETAALAALVDAVCGQFPIDRRRIYACGLSAGAGMAAVLGLNHPELIAAVGLHSSPVFGAGHSQIGALRVMRQGALSTCDAAIADLLARRCAALPMLPLPAILIQGVQDQVVHPVNQQQLARQWLQLNGMPLGPPSRVSVKPAGRSRNALELHDYLTGRTLVLRVARIAGLGHAWSGGDAALKFNAQAGPDASRMLLDFFGRHRRRAK